eukprot:12400427-Karenia_brevis.AAC.1
MVSSAAHGMLEFWLPTEASMSLAPHGILDVSSRTLLGETMGTQRTARSTWQGLRMTVSPA